MKFIKAFKSAMLVLLFSSIFLQNSLAMERYLSWLRGVELRCTQKNPYMTREKATEIIKTLLADPCKHVDQCAFSLRKTAQEFGIRYSDWMEDEEENEKSEKTIIKNGVFGVKMSLSSQFRHYFDQKNTKKKPFLSKKNDKIADFYEKNGNFNALQNLKEELEERIAIMLTETEAPVQSIVEYIIDRVRQFISESS